MKDKEEIYIVLEKTCASLGSEPTTRILGVYNTLKKAKYSIKENIIKFGSWAGKCTIKKCNLK